MGQKVAENTAHERAAAHISEIAKLDAVVDDFARAMKTKLHRKALEGFRGWDDPAMYHKLRFRLARLTRHWFAWNDAQEIDIANLAMMLWFQRERGSSESDVGEPDGQGKD